VSPGGGTGIDVRPLEPSEARARLDELAEVLEDCVAGGASVGYLAPFSREDARAAFERFVAEAERRDRVILAAFDGDRLVGTAQVVLAVPQNQPHRAEIARVLVHRDARRRGIAGLLMAAAEEVAQAEGRTLLVLDAVTGGDAARLYDRLGWTTVGVIPDYALYPDGRRCDTTVFYKRL
jgi:GNAT superfamily N-acetyltransferase